MTFNGQNVRYSRRNKKVLQSTPEKFE